MKFNLYYRFNRVKAFSCGRFIYFRIYKSPKGTVSFEERISFEEKEK